MSPKTEPNNCSVDRFFGTPVRDLTDDAAARSADTPRMTIDPQTHYKTEDGSLPCPHRLKRGGDRRATGPLLFEADGEFARVGENLVKTRPFLLRRANARGLIVAAPSIEDVINVGRRKHTLGKSIARYLAKGVTDAGSIAQVEPTVSAVVALAAFLQTRHRQAEVDKGLDGLSRFDCFNERRQPARRLEPLPAGMVLGEQRVDAALKRKIAGYRRHDLKVDRRPHHQRFQPVCRNVRATDLDRPLLPDRPNEIDVGLTLSPHDATLSEGAECVRARNSNVTLDSRRSLAASTILAQYAGGIERRAFIVRT